MAGPNGGATQQPGWVAPSDLSFNTLCSFFAGLRKIKGAAFKRMAYIKLFVAKNVDKSPHDAFSVFRLVLPVLDAVRGNYGLQESKLADVLLKAAGLDKQSQVAKAVRNWRRPGVKSAGDFAQILRDQLFNVYCGVINPKDPEAARQLKIGHLNQALDELAAASGSIKDQSHILRRLMQKTTPDQMSWIVQIILKSLKINASESTVFKAWHTDAESYYNNSGMDLRFIFNQMIDEKKGYSTSVKPGLAVRPQLALATNSVKWAYHRMHDKEGKLRPFVVESKFDGERMQVHRCEPGAKSPVLYFSRKAIEHGERSSYSVMDEVILRQTKRPCILDGELIVWNKKKLAFEPFGSLKPLVGAIVDKKRSSDLLEFNEIDLDNAAVLDPDYEQPRVGDCELVYVAFDILHDGETAVIERPLSERLKVLEEAIVPSDPVPLEGSCVCARLVALLPGKTRFSATLCSRFGSKEADITDTLEEVARMREEGIIIKALDSTWGPNDRSPNWLKFKPDYVKNVDLDCVVIGAWGGKGGKGGRGGLYTQYLLALKDPPKPGYKVSWTSFCRVGTGLDDDERQEVHDKISPLCQFADAHPPPKCYNITGREKPEVWISDAERSVVFQVQADLRTIRTTKFATGYSLRFPKIAQFNKEKTGLMANSTYELQELVDQQKSTEAGEEDLFPQEGEGGPERKLKRKSSKRDEQRAAKRTRVPPEGRAVVPAARPTDLTQVEVESSALEGCLIHFANHGDCSKAELERVAKRLGGDISQNYIPRVTHILAGREDPRVRGHIKQDRDVICIAWLLDCERQRRRVPLRPRYYLHMSRASLLASTDVDRYGDSYLSDVDSSDVENLLRRDVPPGGIDPADLAASLAEESDFEDTDDERQAQRQLGKRLGGEAAAHAVASYLDAQLAAVGQLDPRFSLLRSCSATLLRLGSGRAQQQEGAGTTGSSSDAGDSSGSCCRKLFPSVSAMQQRGRLALARLQQLQVGAVAAEVRIMGGIVSGTLGPHVTHVVGIVLPRTSTVPSGRAAGEEAAGRRQQQQQQQPVEAEVLLRAVSEQAGGGAAVATLKLGLTTGGTHLVAHRWVDHCLGEAEARGAAKPPPEAGFALAAVGPDQLKDWPWHTFLPKPSPKSARASGVRALPTSLQGAVTAITGPPGGGAQAGGRPTTRRRGRATAIVPRATKPLQPKAEPPAGPEDEEQAGDVGTEHTGDQQQPAAVGAAGVRRRAPARRGRAVTRIGPAQPAGIAVKEEQPSGAAAGAAAAAVEPTALLVKQEPAGTQQLEEQQQQQEGASHTQEQPAQPPAPGAASPAGGSVLRAGRHGSQPPAASRIQPPGAPLASPAANPPVAEAVQVTTAPSLFDAFFGSGGSTFAAPATVAASPPAASAAARSPPPPEQPAIHGPASTATEDLAAVEPSVDTQAAARPKLSLRERARLLGLTNK